MCVCVCVCVCVRACVRACVSVCGCGSMHIELTMAYVFMPVSSAIITSCACVIMYVAVELNILHCYVGSIPAT